MKEHPLGATRPATAPMRSRPGKQRPAAAIVYATQAGGQQAMTAKKGWPLPLSADADLTKISTADVLAQKIDMNDPGARAELDRQLGLVMDTRKKAAWALARKLGAQVKGTYENGGGYELMDVEDGRLIYFSTQNEDSRISIAHEQFWDIHPEEDGTGMQVGIWDIGLVNDQHLAFRFPPPVPDDGYSNLRVRYGDDGTSVELHSTHVAGTMGANFFVPTQPADQDAPWYVGTAPRSFIKSYDWTDDVQEMTADCATFAQNVPRLGVSNHSYTASAGWAQTNLTDTSGKRIWQWHGDFLDDDNPANDLHRQHGQYGTRSSSLDGLHYLKPFYLSFWSAGNDRVENPPAGHPWIFQVGQPRPYDASKHPTGDGLYKQGYDTISQNGCAKNVLTVGAVSAAVDETTGERDLSAVTMPSFPSWGPADDGRIKPDVVANGVDVYSVGFPGDRATAKISGTSMAAPAVSGSAVLLQSLYYGRHHANGMRASTLKGLIIHTADDIGPPVAPPGPDYQTGWGLMNVRTASDLIDLDADHLAGGKIIEDQVTQGNVRQFTFEWDGNSPLRVTLCWTDPSALGVPAHDDRAWTLQNDLDLVVTGPTGTVHRPYMMPYVGDWTAATLASPAAEGVNVTDNVEQVFDPTPLPGLYTITVDGNVNLTDNLQAYSLIVSGFSGPVDIAVEHPAGTDLLDGTGVVSFGSVAAGQSVLRTLTIKNVGVGNLTLGAITVDGANASDFAVGQPGVTTLAGGQSTTLAVTFNSGFAGDRNAMLHIASNLAGTENPFDILLNGTGTAVPTFTPSYQVLRSFDNLPPGYLGGHDPRGGLNESLTGTTFGGGDHNAGTVYQVSPDSGAVSIVKHLGAPLPNYIWEPNSPIGGAPYFLCLGGGNQYGCISYMGNLLASFPTGWSLPDYAELTGQGGGVFGVGYYQRPMTLQRYETIFKATLTGGGSITPLVAFDGVVHKGSNVCYRLEPGPDGWMYGTTAGGGVSNFGTVFKMDGSGNLVTILEFGAVPGFALGATPNRGGLTFASDGNFYGTTGSKLFQIKPDGSYAALCSLGYETTASNRLVEGPDGNLYGVNSPYGLVFRLRLRPHGGPFTSADYAPLVYFYGSPPVWPPPHVPPPAALVFGFDGNIYGTTRQGGLYNDGTVYRVLTNFGGDGDIRVFQPAGNQLRYLDTVFFTPVAVGQSVLKTFVITNVGTGQLFLKHVDEAGPNDADYIVTPPSTDVLYPGASTSLTVAFAPQVPGLRTASISIVTNDGGGAFDIVLSNALPEIAIEQPAGTDLVDDRSAVSFGTALTGANITRVFEIKNTGAGDLKIEDITFDGPGAADFSADPSGEATIHQGDQQTVTVVFVPSAEGLRFATMHVASDDEDEDPFDIVVSGAGVVPVLPKPEIVVEQPAGSNLVDGAASVSFGSGVTGMPLSRIFTVTNTGDADLSLGSISFDGANGADFAATPPGSTVLAPDASTTFNVTFTPGVAGTRSAVLHLGSNEDDENPFDVELTGTGIAPVPEIGVEQPEGSNLTDNSGALNFGASVLGAGVERVFTIRNTGTGNLTGLSITKDGSGSSAFIVSAPGSTTVAPGASTTFTVTFVPSAALQVSAAIHIASNDANENPFDISMFGLGVAPEIAVSYTYGALSDGVSSINFGSALVGQGLEQVLYISNTGTTDLTGLAITIDGANAADFSVNLQPPAVIVPGAVVTARIGFTPSASGARSAALHIASSDSNENPFDITLGGTGVMPEIAVFGPNFASLTDGVSTVDMGMLKVGATGTQQSFAIQNAGNTDGLVVTSITKDGAHSGDFTLISINSDPIAQGGSRTFFVTFAPGGPGVRTAALHIANNDSDENPFDIVLTGTGTVPDIVVEHPSGTGLTDGGSTIDFGNSQSVGQAQSKTFTVRNTGTAILSVQGVTKDGAHSGDFVLGGQAASGSVINISNGASTTFTVTFTPGALGARTAAIHVASDDPDENPFDIVLTGSASALPTHQLLWAFRMAPPKNPAYGRLVAGADGYLWGTTQSGGESSYGTVFRVKPDGPDLATMVSFTSNGAANKGAEPYNGLALGVDSFFYGTTQSGGAGNFGTIFKASAAGTVTTLVEFTDNGASNKGSSPRGELIQHSDGNFYGTTYSGGASSLGTVFKMTPAGALTTLVEFSGNGASNKGSNPAAGLVLGADGNFYGATHGGGTSSLGTVFRMTTAGALTTLVNFTGNGASNKGSNPYGRLIQASDGNFYGTTNVGGTSSLGTVFRMTTAGALTTLVNFTGNGASNKGSNPRAELVQANDGNLYGTASAGGSSGFGTVFKMTLAGALTTLVQFTDNGASNKGRMPLGGLVQRADGDLYGMTQLGGSLGVGTFFKTTLAGALTTLSDFNVPASSYGNPNGGLVHYSTDGSFYGTTDDGGAARYGTIYKMTTAGAVTALVEFTGNGASNKGASPQTGLTLGLDGSFYGATYAGGTGNFGTLFKMTPGGALTTLAEFTGIGGAVPGANPLAGPVLGGDGNFYGTTYQGGSAAGASLGTVFKMMPAGAFTMLLEFTRFPATANPGSFPSAALALGSDGLFYGTTYNGGGQFTNDGTAFKVTVAGALTSLVAFGNTVTPKGANPRCALVQGADGDFYGTTLNGGTIAFGTFYGTIFKMTPAGALTTLVEFSNAGVTNRGAYPMAGLAQGPDGNFYGTTTAGGAGSYGTVFRMTPAGLLTTLIEFTGDGSQANNGSTPPPGRLVFGPDGHIYGTTSSGGPYRGGTIFRLLSGPLPEIAVESPAGVDVTDGGGDLSFAAAVGGNELRTVVIRNTGTAALTGLAVVKDGANAADFTVGSLGATSLAPGASTTFNITFAPGALGARPAALHISSNDVDENPFDIVLAGQGVAQEIAVEQPEGSALSDGVGAVAFGGTPLGIPALKVFTVRNTGALPLSGLSLSKSGTNAADFTLGALGLSVLPPGGAASFEVSFSPATVGAKTAAIQIASNDADENPFDISLTGAGDAPEIVVEQPVGTGLADGTSTVTFGAIIVGTPVVKTFTIRNTGSLDLTGLAIAADGENAADFIIGSLSSTTAPPGGSATFTVTFDPVSGGDNKTASLHVSSNDADENPFDIALSGGARVIASFKQGASDPFGGPAYAGMEDVWLYNNSGNATDQNTGGDTRVIIGGLGGGSDRHQLMRFNVSGLGGKFTAIHDVRLRIFWNGANSNSGTIQVYSVAAANAGWVEGGGLTGATAPAGVSTWGHRVRATQSWAGSQGASTAGTDYVNSLLGSAAYASAATDQSFDLPFTDGSIISTWLGGTNAGLFLRTAAQTNEAVFHSSESASNSFRPELIIECTPSAPEITVEQPVGAPLASGASRGFGTIEAGTTASLFFTIRNTGSSDLTGLAVAKAGADPGSFTVSGPAASVLAPAASTTVTIAFSPASLGPKSALIQIASNDSNENPFDILVSGDATDVSGPSGGSLVLVPASPVDAGQSVTAVFGDWSDAHPPLAFQLLINSMPVSAPGPSPFVEFSAPAAGSYTIKGRITDSLGNVTEVTQLLQVRGPQEAWRNAYFGTPQNSGIAADTFDYDGDGLANLAEYAFGLNPISGSSRQLPAWQIIGGDYVVSFQETAGVEGVVFGAEWSTSMASESWTPIADSGTQGTHEFRVSIGAASNLFVRLKVTKP